MPLEGIDELCSHSDLIPGLLHTPLQYVLHSQLLGHLLYLHGLSLVAEGGVSGNDKELRNLERAVIRPLAQAVAEDLLVWIAGHVHEGHDSDRGLVREREGHFFF